MTHNQDLQDNHQHKHILNDKDVFSGIRRQRLMQICMVSSFALIASLLVARSLTLVIFSIGLSCLLVAFIFAYRHKITVSAYILLGSLTTMLFALAFTGAGLFDLAILGYPSLFIFAAILGGVGLFISILIFVISQCTILAWLTLNGSITPNIPSLSWSHLVFILVIFIVTSFSVYILVRDIKRLMLSLHKENTKVQRSQTQIQHLAHHDPLTDLPNRYYGEILFTQSLADSLKNHQQLALLFFDLDNFKPVNDVLGHAAGDLLLKELAQRLTSILEANQYLIRFGGDEFLLLAPHSNDLAHLNKLAHELIRQCSLVFTIQQTQVAVSASLGIACTSQHGTNFKQLCRKADIAMYQAKEAGKSTFHFYDSYMDKASDAKFKLLQTLRPAVSQKQFQLYYQPMVDLKSGSVTAVEALLRWPQPDGSTITPDQFIPLAESSGLINEIGQWVIQEACRFCAKQRQQGHPKLRVAINLSVMQFKDGHLQDTVEDALRKAKLPAEALELELTESLLIDDTHQIEKQLNRLSQLGASIAIDDFGTGYSNLGYLREFSASKLKIDRSFINSLVSDKQDDSIVKAIINMASSLGLKTVAEGIEDKATLNKLIALGCEIGQGYYWSKPLPENVLTGYLNKT
ncbi:putative bifunctional diguanylate cyclase/phosphodiesterase [Paraglaciecola marina]|uniref:putative bifunctional diguanylate cyclase/phosphodiesterase n=1 Tax=Paraglaciecola marina TaxID=2500157 RepID=UPI0010616177|nr:EAL domain-containing protein [Paraglaciecola marina]